MIPLRVARDMRYAIAPEQSGTSGHGVLIGSKNPSERVEDWQKPKDAGHEGLVHL